MDNLTENKKIEITNIIEGIKSGDLVLDSFIHMVAVGDMIHRYFAKKLAKIGLTRVEFAILYTLNTKFEELAPTFISRRIPRAKHTISKAITELEEKNFVKKDSGLSREQCQSDEIW